ncbi:Very-long-chain (3R)-3-hydroxyacyl-CoA dehydratase [Fasciola hepatica]|uniref:Very-long-chain (3R)-3-hydroxyacyl-CoA dehydratase n=1 Tax=Fasciola hepatica TaxID=6192 RepID=A0A4E0R2W6_FASHE|nr:Very-long-chain (3R)-3-hydroxyacyl-CoA dehydratase [Fasciola hepatica]
MTEQMDAHPFVHWGQNETHVFLSIRLSDSEASDQISTSWGQQHLCCFPVFNLTFPTGDVRVKIDDELLDFEGLGTGAHGRRIYKFSLAYYLPVIAKESHFTVTGRAVLVKLRKEYRETWPRLTVQADRAAWICLDFDLYQFDASDLDTDDNDENGETETKRRKNEQETKGEDVVKSDQVKIKVIRPSKEERDRHNAEMKELEEEETWEAFLKVLRHPLTIYLLLFNLFQFAGFLCVWGKLVLHWLQPDSTDHTDWFEFVLPRLALIQLVQFLEPLHAVLGWVRTSPSTSFAQVLGRAFGLFFVVLPHSEFHSSTTVFWLFFAWSSIEIFRYPHYTLSLLGFRSGLLTYLRYTLWIPFYPLGFMCEGSLCVKALPLVSKSRRFCIDMPNAFNMSLEFPLLLHVWLLAMPTAFYVLMRHMYVQRRRVIGPRPRIGSDQMGFFSFIPILRSMIYGKKTALDGTSSRPFSKSRHVLPASEVGSPLSKLQ